MTTKEKLRALIDRLPDDVSLEDVQYQIYVMEKVELARESEKDGLIDHDDIKREFSE